MNRRELIKTVLFSTFAALAPKGLWAAIKPRASSISIGQLLQASYPAVLNEMKQGHRWVTHELRKADREGRILFRDLGPVVQEGSTLYEISQAAVPMIWSRETERKLKTETDKVTFVAQLLENALQALEFLIEEKLGDGRMVVSKTYNHDLGCLQTVGPSVWVDPKDGTEHAIPESYVIKVYSAMAFLPKGPAFVSIQG